MRNRQKQRELKRKQKREEMLDTRNSYGYKDLTPYTAVLNIRSKEASKVS